MSRARGALVALAFPLALATCVAPVALVGCGGGSGGGSQGAAVPVGARLASLQVSTGTLSPAFSATTTDYLDGPARLDPSVTVTATTAVAGASMTLDATPLTSGVPSAPIDLPMGYLTQVTITVTATDGVTQAAYRVLFDRVPITGSPTYVKPSNTDGGDAFGTSIAVSGDTMVVGAPNEDSNAKGVGGNQGNNAAQASGAAYVFVRSGNTWVQQAYVKASNTGAGDGFGTSVAISGDTIVVGAPFERSDATGVDGNAYDESLDRAGAAYVFQRAGSTWSQSAYLKASNTDWYAEFGSSVAISGDTILVGAPYESSDSQGIDGSQVRSNAGLFSGAVYVFSRFGASWRQRTYVKASNTDSGEDHFGSCLAIDGDTFVVGAYAEDSTATGVDGNQTDNNGAGSGAAYVFVRDVATWKQEAYLKASTNGIDALFGSSVAVSGDTILVGCPYEDGGSGGIDGDEHLRTAPQSGAAYVFVRSASTWTQQAYVKASTPGSDDHFGWSVALEGDLAVVGAPDEDGGGIGLGGKPADNTAANSGAAYVFVRSGATWSPGAYAKALNTNAGDRFGVSVAVSGGFVSVGAAGEASRTTGVGGPFADNSAPGSGATYDYR